MKVQKIANYEKYEIMEDGTVISRAQLIPKVLKPQKVTQSKKKYLAVGLYNDENRKNNKGCKIPKFYYVHRLVWETFMGEIPEGKEIDHIDGNPHNNSLSNLQIVTRRENLLKHLRTPNWIFLRDHREEVIKDYVELFSMKKVADKWGVTEITVWRAIKNKTHTKKEINNQYFYFYNLYDKDKQDLFATTDLRNKSHKFIKELWKQHLDAKSV